MVYLVVLIVVIVINAILGAIMADVAKAKGYNGSEHSFLYVFIFGIFGCLYVIGLPDLVIRMNQRELISLLSSKSFNSGTPAQNGSNANYNDIPEL